jgi:hypothetical protein
MKKFRLYLVLVAIALVSLPALYASTGPFDEEARIDSIQPGQDNPLAVDTNIPAVIEEVEEINDEINELAENAGEDLEEDAESVKKIVEHTVQTGESLWVIAQKLLGDGNRYREIIEANKDQYPSLEKNPDLIYTGWVFKVPVDEEELADENPAPAPEDDEESEGDEAEVDDDSGTPADQVTQIPNWTVKQKIENLQKAVDEANRRLLSQNKRIAALNSDTIRFLIDNGFMTEEEWMAMNPPEGYTYRLDRVGKVELVDDKNVPLTNEQISEMDSEAAQSAEEPASSEEADDEEEAASEEPEEEPDGNNIVDSGDDDEEEPSQEAEAPEQEADEDEEEAQVSEEEVQQAANTQYQKMLNELGLKDFSDNDDYYKGVRNGSKFMSEGLFSGTTPFFKFVNYSDYPYYNIAAMQRQLKKLQERYEKQVRKGKTSRFLGIFGSTIESTGKEIQKVKARLDKAGSELKDAIKKAENKAMELKVSVKADKKSIEKLQAELDKIDIYDSANAKEVQEKTKAIKKLNKNVEKAEKKLKNFDELKKVFG